MDVLVLLAGGALVLAGAAIGRFLPPRRGPATPRSPEPVCGCGHHYSMHGPETGQCQAGWREACTWNTKGTPVAWRDESCACVRYSGPVPLPEYYATEITGGSS